MILLPVLLMLFGLVLAFGRAATADTDVAHAARVGARAAAAAQTMGGAQQRATVVVDNSLVDSGLACVRREVAVGGGLQPGGQVTVTVTCVASLGDLSGLGLLPGSRTLTATATEVVDVHRGGR
ncbi:MAG: TadE/TadG family type IV pilus assembly protein [Desertimonas sp.]